MREATFKFSLEVEEMLQRIAALEAALARLDQQKVSLSIDLTSLEQQVQSAFAASPIEVPITFDPQSIQDALNRLGPFNIGGGGAGGGAETGDDLKDIGGILQEILAALEPLQQINVSLQQLNVGMLGEHDPMEATDLYSMRGMMTRMTAMGGGGGRGGDRGGGGGGGGGGADEEGPEAPFWWQLLKRLGPAAAIAHIGGRIAQETLQQGYITPEDVMGAVLGATPVVGGTASQIMQALEVHRTGPFQQALRSGETGIGAGPTGTAVTQPFMWEILLNLMRGALKLTGTGMDLGALSQLAQENLTTQLTTQLNTIFPELGSWLMPKMPPQLMPYMGESFAPGITSLGRTLAGPTMVSAGRTYPGTVHRYGLDIDTTFWAAIIAEQQGDYAGAMDIRALAQARQDVQALHLRRGTAPPPTTTHFFVRGVGEKDVPLGSVPDLLYEEQRVSEAQRRRVQQARGVSGAEWGWQAMGGAGTGSTEFQDYLKDQKAQLHILGKSYDIQIKQYELLVEQAPNVTMRLSLQETLDTLKAARFEAQGEARKMGLEAAQYLPAASLQKMMGAAQTTMELFGIAPFAVGPAGRQAALWQTLAGISQERTEARLQWHQFRVDLGRPLTPREELEQEQQEWRWTLQEAQARQQAATYAPTLARAEQLSWVQYQMQMAPMLPLLGGPAAAANLAQRGMGAIAGARGDYLAQMEDLRQRQGGSLQPDQQRTFNETMRMFGLQEMGFLGTLMQNVPGALLSQTRMGEPEGAASLVPARRIQNLLGLTRTDTTLSQMWTGANLGFGAVGALDQYLGAGTGLLSAYGQGMGTMEPGNPANLLMEGANRAGAALARFTQAVEIAAQKMQQVGGQGAGGNQGQAGFWNQGNR